MPRFLRSTRTSLILPKSARSKFACSLDRDREEKRICHPRWSHNALEAHFGLGNATTVDTLRVQWPSGTVEEFQNVGTRQYLTITEPARLRAASSAGTPQFTLQGGRGMRYEIQASSDLQTWSALSTTTITNLDGTARITEANPPGSASHFYRAVLR